MSDLLPCGHPVQDSQFETAAGRLLLCEPVKAPLAFIDLPGTVWCTECLRWLDLTDDQYRHLAEIGGAR